MPLQWSPMVGQVRCKPRQTESEDKEREGRGGQSSNKSYCCFFTSKELTMSEC